MEQNLTSFGDLAFVKFDLVVKFVSVLIKQSYLCVQPFAVYDQHFKAFVKLSLIHI